MQANYAWIIETGRKLVYAVNEVGLGDSDLSSLWLYDAQTRGRRKIMYEYVGIMDLHEAVTSQNKTALLVEMSDESGASHLAVVDPARGEVFFQREVKVIERSGDQIMLGYFRMDDWDNINNGVKVKPYKTERLNLNELLRRRVIYNRPVPR